MTYLFRSKAAGDVLMLSTSGDQLLRIIGKESAPTGIIEASTLASSIQAIEAAIATEETGLAQASEPASQGCPGDASVQGVSLRQRAWPLLEMMRSAKGSACEIVWGV
jgi:hypothetical protein